MAVSGSKNYSITRGDIITAALSKIGEYDAGEGVDGADTTLAARSLNLLVKALVGKGADLFLRQTVTLFLQKDQQSYSLGSSSADHHTTSFVETTLSAAEASGQTVISVTDSTGMTAADNVGIKMDDGSMHWTTIVSVDSGVQITITTATDDDAASGNKVYTYTTKADRPQKLLYAFRRDTSSIDTEIDIIGETEYHQQSNKGSSGPPVEVWYRPTLTNGTLYVWPVDGGSSLDKLVLITQTLPDDFDNTGDNPEFPIEWGETLVYLLAARLSSDYGLPRLERREMRMEANAMLEDMLDYDVENASMIIAMGSE